MNNYGQNKMDMFIHWWVTLNDNGSILRFQRIKPHHPIFYVGQNHYRPLEPILLGLLLDCSRQHFESIFSLVLSELILIILIRGRAWIGLILDVLIINDFCFFLLGHIFLNFLLNEFWKTLEHFLGRITFLTVKLLGSSSELRFIIALYWLNGATC